ncbi:hypothetical protein ACFQMA_03790 [Halosimplex aquaticum]|uniref:Outer membrane lipoprotein-sorting protein n=1 Tax=Halosimplex aquaticum TaxID=3026162 RepID=A0ABD5XZG1_9EURY|nr:hypothetical protein [Halosimplex aquaticum]
MGKRAVVLVALVLLSGCSAVPFGSDSQQGAPTDTVTPVPVTDADGGATATATAADLPPGVSADGSVNAIELARAHSAYVENRSYTWFVDYDTGEQDFLGGVFTRRAVVGNGSFFVQQASLGSGANTSLYVNESGGFLRSTEGNETRYDLIEVPGDHSQYVFADAAIRRFLNGARFAVTTVERGGQTYYRLYTADGPVPDTLASSSVAIRNYSATAYVTPDGFVRSLSVEYDRFVGGDRSDVSFRYDYSGVGESTPRAPTWIGNVSRRSTPEPVQPGTTAPNGTTAPGGSTATTDEPTATDELDE